MSQEKDGQQMQCCRISHTKMRHLQVAKLEQFQLMMNDIVRNAIAENNQALGQAVSEHDRRESDQRDELSDAGAGGAGRRAVSGKLG